MQLYNAPRIYWLGAVAANETHRYVQVVDGAGAGRLRPTQPPVVLPLESVGISECGSPHGEQLFYGPPPARCRAGAHIDGTAQHGFAEIVVPWMPLPHLIRNATLNKVVRYPAKSQPQVTVQRWGHFERCYPAPANDPFDGLYCMEQSSASYYVRGTNSTVWLNPVPQHTMLVLYCLIQVYVLALLASSENPKSDPALMPLAANTAIGSSVYLAYVVSRGSTVPGLADEIGESQATAVCGVIAVVCVALSAAAWVIAMLDTNTGTAAESRGISLLGWRLVPTNALPTASIAMRELLEVPMLLSLAIMWPPHHGRLFATTLNLAIGGVVPTAAGRAAFHYSRPTNSIRLWAAAMVVAGVCGGGILLLPVVSQSGAVGRGTPAIVLCGTMATHALLAGFAVARRQAERAVADAELLRQQEIEAWRLQQQQARQPQSAVRRARAKQ
jgi:hypothetical protein